VHGNVLTIKTCHIDMCDDKTVVKDQMVNEHGKKVLEGSAKDKAEHKCGHLWVIMGSVVQVRLTQGQRGHVSEVMSHQLTMVQFT